MENTTLENAIREEAGRTIKDIQEKEAEEIRRLDEEYAREIDHLRGRTAAEIQARIDQELSRLENRSRLERKKLMLTSVEQFINRMVAEVMKGIRSSAHYRPFLLNAVRSAVGQISAGVEIKLVRDDLAFEKELMAAAKADGRNNHAAVKEDPGIQWGGCLIRDEAGGRIFNNTLERIYFRKSLLIRQKLMNHLADHSGEVKTETLPKDKT